MRRQQGEKERGGGAREWGRDRAQCPHELIFPWILFRALVSASYMVTGGPTVQMTGGQRLASERIVAIVDSPGIDLGCTHLLILN